MEVVQLDRGHSGLERLADLLVRPDPPDSRLGTSGEQPYIVGAQASPLLWQWAQARATTKYNGNTLFTSTVRIPAGLTVVIGDVTVTGASTAWTNVDANSWLVLSSGLSMSGTTGAGLCSTRRHVFPTGWTFRPGTFRSM